MKTNPANEIKEWNKLGKCMKDFANSFGMACGCDKCSKEFVKELDLLLTNKCQQSYAVEQNMKIKLENTYKKNYIEILPMFAIRQKPFKFCIGWLFWTIHFN